MKLFFSLCYVVLLPSCVMIDSKVSDVQPAATGMASFDGVYRNLASYRSSGGGLHTEEHLQEYFGCKAFPEVAEVIQLRGVSDRLEAEIRFRNGRTEKRTLRLNQACTFENGYLVFATKVTGSGGNDSPSLGYLGSSGSRWTIDREGNLVVISNEAALGTVTIIPFAMATRWMAVFPKIR